MKLPFVSRAAYEEVQARLEVVRQCLDWRIADAVRAESQYATLLEKYHALKSNGFTAPPVPVSQPFSRDALIGRAIDSVPASRDPKNRSAMWQQVMVDRAAGITDEEIIASIRRGSRPAEEMA